MYYIFIALAVVADQFIKNLVTTTMKPGDSLTVIDGFFNINYIQNSGAAFSMFENMRVVLIILPAVFAAAGLAYLFANRHNKKPLFDWGVALIVAGGLGNMIDRIMNGYVVDYLSFGSFAVFNFADMCVTVGCALILINAFTVSRRGKK